MSKNHSATATWRICDKSRKTAINLWRGASLIHRFTSRVRARVCEVQASSMMTMERRYMLSHPIIIPLIYWQFGPYIIRRRVGCRCQKKEEITYVRFQWKIRPHHRWEPGIGTRAGAAAFC